MKPTIAYPAIPAFPLIAKAQAAPAGLLLELRTGERYSRSGGRSSFVLGRNPAGMNPKEYDDHVRHAAAAGERFMRIHFTYIPPNEKSGEIDPGMLQSRDVILDAAEKHGLAVLPVLGVRAYWNDGSNKETWHTWDKNPFNVAQGSPAISGTFMVTINETACGRLNWDGVPDKSGKMSGGQYEITVQTENNEVVLKERTRSSGKGIRSDIAAKTIVPADRIPGTSKISQTTVTVVRTEEKKRTRIPNQDPEAAR